MFSLLTIQIGGHINIMILINFFRLSFYTIKYYNKNINKFIFHGVNVANPGTPANVGE